MRGTARVPATHCYKGHGCKSRRLGLPCIEQEYQRKDYWGGGKERVIWIST